MLVGCIHLFVGQQGVYQVNKNSMLLTKLDKVFIETLTICL